MESRSNVRNRVDNALAWAGRLAASMVLACVAPAWAADIASVVVTPDLRIESTVVGGNAAAALVTLDAPAPAGGITVTLTSDKPAVATVPATVKVAEGARQAAFTVSTVVQSDPVFVRITARLGTTTRSTSIRVADDVAAYAKDCYSRLRIKETDFAGPFVCKNGKQLISVVNGKTVDITLPGGGPNPDNAGAFPATCDFPTWLANDDRCYGNSFIQSLGIAGNDQFQAALLCRHKTNWEGICSGGTTPGVACTRDPNCAGGGKCVIGDKDFPDIAMILFNKDNGETCWFQTDDTACNAGERRCDGTRVPAPHTADARKFFLPPSGAAKINCVRCHDNGPWMNSRWMNNVIELEDTPAGPYLNKGRHFDKWATTTFVTVKRDGLPKEGQTCTSCHKIHAKEITPDPVPAFSRLYGRDYLTMRHWLDFSVGLDFPPGANARGKQLDEDHALWMPPSHGLGNADFQKTYKAHLDALKACMAKKGQETPENRMKGSNCAVRTVAPTNPKPSGSGASLRGVLGDGTVIVREVTRTGHTADIPRTVPPGTSLVLSWEADSSYHACAIEAQFPPGVAPAPANAGGWNLQDAPAVLGPFTAPGEYRFDMYCERKESANFVLEVSGGGSRRPAMLAIQPIVNSYGGNMATVLPGPSSSRANARKADALSLYWSATNTRDDCVVTELFEPPGSAPGRSFTGASGFVSIELLGMADQTYTLSCTATDGTPHSVKTTFHPVGGVQCDVNQDGAIDRTDIDAIFAARGFAALPQDLRDADGDKLITVNDARVCVNLCSKRLCAR